MQIRSVHSATELKSYLDDYRAKSDYTVERIALGEVDNYASPAATPEKKNHWRTTSTGDIARGDGLFFTVSGVRVRPQGAKGGSYDQPLFADNQVGTVILVRDRETGDILVDMKAEPGTDSDRRHISLSPSVQASAARLTLAKEKPNGDGVLSLLGVLAGTPDIGLDKLIEIQQDPGRFLAKRNRYGVVNIPSKAVLNDIALPSMVWAKVSDVTDDLNATELNCHMWQLLGILAKNQNHSPL